MRGQIVFWNSSIPSLVLLLATAIQALPIRAEPRTEAEPPPVAASSSEPPKATIANASIVFADRLERELGVPGGLTSQDLAHKAVRTSHSLQARRAEVTAAAAEVDRAFAAYLPKMTLLGRYTRLSKIDTGSKFSLVVAPEVTNGPIPAGSELESVPLQFDSPLDNFLLQASLTVPVSDYFLRVSKSHQSAKLVESASWKNLAASQLAAIADAKVIYYDWVRARLNARVAEQALLDTQAHLADVQNALQAGSASRADVLGIEARVADSERVLESATNWVARLEEELRILRHDPPGTRYTVGEALGAEAGLDLPDRQPELVVLALSRRPELEALRLRASSIEKSVALERATYAPRLELFGNAQYENPSRRVIPQQDEFIGSWDAGVQLSWTPSDIPGAAASVSRLTANATAILAERRATEDQIRREVTAAHTALLDARASIRTSARSLAAAEESYRVRRVLFQNGRATSVELLDAELELTRVRLLAVSARIDLRVARVRLDYAIGEPPRFLAGSSKTIVTSGTRH